MSLHKEKLEGFRKQLQARRDALTRDIRKKSSELTRDDANFADAVDQASAETDRQLIAQMKNREEQVLVQINQALRRLDDGVFGDCQECGESISEARLQAFPFTTLCIDCKAELESKRNDSHRGHSDDPAHRRRSGTCRNHGYRTGDGAT